MTGTIIQLHDPLEHQRAVYDASLRYNSTLMIGSVGSGKSETLATVGLRESLMYPDNHGLVLRRTLDELLATTHESFLEVVPQELIVRSRRDNSGPTYWIRPIDWDGREDTLSVVVFRSAIHAGRQDPDKFKSLNLGWVVIDELSEINEQVVLMLWSRLRRRDTRQILVAATNPPNDAKHWIFKYWDLSDPHGGRSGHCYLVRSQTADNHYLPDDYIERLMSMYPASWVHKYILGEIGFVGEGEPVYGTDYSDTLHVVEFDIRREYPIIRSIDFGYRRPAISWHQFVDCGGDRQLRVTDEYLGQDIRLDEFWMLAMERERALFGEHSAGCETVGDPAGLQTNDQSGRSDIELLESLGVDVRLDCNRVRNSPRYRTALVRQWLQPGINGEPGLIVHPRCKIIREGFCGGYRFQTDRSTGEVLEIPLKDGYYDHLADTVQYVVVNFTSFNNMLESPGYDEMQVTHAGDPMETALYMRRRYA